MNSTVIARDISRLQEQLAALNQEARVVRDKQNADIQQMFHTLQQVNQAQQSSAKSVADTSKAQLDALQHRIVDECATMISSHQAALTAAVQNAMDATRGAAGAVHSVAVRGALIRCLFPTDMFVVTGCNFKCGCCNGCVNISCFLEVFTRCERVCCLIVCLSDSAVPNSQAHNVTYRLNPRVFAQNFRLCGATSMPMPGRQWN